MHTHRHTIAHIFMATALAAQAHAALPGSSPEQNRAFVLTMLEVRDNALKNFSMKVTVTHQNIELATNVHRFLYRDKYEIRRLNDMLWMEVKNHVGEDGTYQKTSTFTWDGHVGRGLGVPSAAARSEAGSIVGRIDPDENGNFATRRMNKLLGIRVQSDRGAMAAALWFRRVMSETTDIQISEEGIGDQSTIRVNVVEPYNIRRTFWLDPSRDFMVTKFEFFQGDDLKYNKETIEAVESKRIDGLWIPTEARARSGTSAVSSTETENVYKVEAFRSNANTESDVVLAFPVNCSVVDTIQHMSYVVRPDGKITCVR